jgi:Lrp/AsnC family leucine-responsive transcriptional regulator
MEIKLDDKDKKIINALKEDSKLSTSKLSRKLNLPITTIFHRIKKLEKNKVIKKYTIDVDEEKLGKPLTAWILLNVGRDLLKGTGKDHDIVSSEILKFPEVEKVYNVTGNFDILVKVRAKDVKELNRFLIKELRRMEGIEKSQTSIVLNAFLK